MVLPDVIKQGDPNGWIAITVRIICTRNRIARSGVRSNTLLPTCSGQLYCHGDDCRLAFSIADAQAHGHLKACIDPESDKNFTGHPSSAENMQSAYATSTALVITARLCSDLPKCSKNDFWCDWLFGNSAICQRFYRIIYGVHYHARCRASARLAGPFSP